jgi:hypothetical protein
MHGCTEKKGSAPRRVERRTKVGEESKLHSHNDERLLLLLLTA